MLPHAFPTRLSALALLIGGSLLAAVPVAPAAAAGAMPSLVARALHDTNSARTLVHRDHSVLTTPIGTVTTRGQSVEDEVHARKRLQEAVSVSITGADGKPRSLRYTVDLVFLPGSTYYRTSLAPRWSRQNGGAYPDPYTGGWQQGRTTVSLPEGIAYRSSSTRAGQTVAHFTFVNRTARGMLDLWAAGGATPYIVREEETLHSVSGPSGSERLQIVFGQFNRPVRIVPPGRVLR